MTDGESRVFEGDDNQPQKSMAPYKTWIQTVMQHWFRAWGYSDFSNHFYSLDINQFAQLCWSINFVKSNRI